jgi:DNA-binding NarL/FixJ family response regulator
MAIRVALADRAGTSRRVVAALLSELPEVELVATVGDADELATALLSAHADVLVIDDRMIVERLPTRDAALRVIVMGLDDDPRYAVRAREGGAIAWIPKEEAAELLPGLIAAGPVSRSPRPRQGRGAAAPECAPSPSSRRRGLTRSTATR